MRYSVILFVAFLPQFAATQTTNWISPVSSNWNNAANWDAGIPLTSGFTASISASGQTVTLDTSPAIDALNLTAGTLTNTAQTLTLAPPSTSIAPLTMGSATLNINNDGSNNVNGALVFSLTGSNSTYNATGTSGSIINVNSGTIAINDGGNNNTLSLTGGGQINLAYNGSSIVPATITGVSGQETLITDFNISGQGLISNLELTFSGTVDSNAGGTLTLRPSFFGLTNNGTLQASNGSLVIDTVTNESIFGNNGAMNVGGAGNSISFYAASGYASFGNTSTGIVNVNDGGTFNISGTGALQIQNDGAINLNSTGSSTTLNLNGSGATFTFNGAGSIDLSASSGNQILGVTGGETLVNNETITGAGSIGNLALQNQGTIVASGGTLTISNLTSYDSGTGTLTNGSYGANNTSLIIQNLTPIQTIGADAVVTLSGVNALITADGTTNALAALSTNNGSLIVTGGNTLALTGASTFTNNGYLQVDAASTFNTGLATFQSLDATGSLNSGQYNIGGTFQYTAQGSGYISTIGSSAAVTLNGAGSLITFNGSTDALSQLSNNSGSLTLTGSRSLTLSNISTYSNSGFLEVDNGSTFDTRAGLFQNVDTSGNLTGAYQIGGTFEYTPQVGASGITSIDLKGSLSLSGTGQILYGPGSGSNALASLNTNNGLLSLTNSASLAVSGTFSNTFFGELTLSSGASFSANGLLTNTGLIYADGAGTTLTAQGYYGGNQSALLGVASLLSVTNGAVADLRSGSLGGFQNLINEGGSGTLVNGFYVVGGTLSIDAANDGSGNPLGINTIDVSAALQLSGAGQILYGAAGCTVGNTCTNALAQFTQNNGLLSLVQGANLTVSSMTVGLSGLLELASGSAMTVSGATTINGGLEVDGHTTTFAGQGGLTVGAAGGIILDHGATADFRTPGGGFNTFTNLGGGTLTSGPTLTDGVLTGGYYGINGTFIYDATNGGAAGQILAIATGTEIDLAGSGQILTGAAATNALGALQENDGIFQLLDGGEENTTPATGVFENAAGASLILESGALFATNLQNDGITNIDGDSLVVAGNYTQSGGTTTVDGTIEAEVSVTGGTLSGNGIVAGDLTQSGGTVQPGDAPGVLNILGNYTQNSGDLLIEFSGMTNPGSDWSQLIVEGIADLSGQIDVELINPAIDFQAGDIFAILYATSVENGGVTFDLPNLGDGLEFVPVFQSGELDLDVEAGSATPEPGAWLLLAAGLALLRWRKRAIAPSTFSRSGTAVS